MDTTIENELIDTLERRAERRADRRKAIMMGGAALAGMMLTSKMAKAQAAAITDADVLNFALNLEYLEAQFYTLATAGVFITDPSVAISINSSDGMTQGGTVVTKAGINMPVAKIAFTTPVLADYAMETAMEEQNHVRFLQSGIAAEMGVAVAMPDIDLFNSFNALAAAAGIGSAFDPFDGTETSFLLGAYIFEDVGVSAYNGGATVLTNPDNLQYAAGILAVEAYHAGSIRTRIYAAGATAQMISQQISTARASLSAAKATTPPTTPDDIGVGLNASTGDATIVNADANAITWVRTPAQVLNIVYGGVAGGGAFFPKGMNGNIK